MPVTKQQALDYHFGAHPGKIEVTPTKPCLTQHDLSLAYTPGVADPCLEIEKNPHDAYKYTAAAIWWRWSPMAPQCSAWATSARSPASLSWKARPSCSNVLPA